MNALFQKKDLAPARRVCLCLKEKRLEKGVNLNTLASRTKIDKKYLIAIEKCQFQKLPEGEIYSKNFIKKYLTALKVDPEPYLKQYLEEEASFAEKKITHPKKNLHNLNFSDLPAMIRLAASVGIILVVVLYLGLQIRHILQPPKLLLHSPQNGYVSDSVSVLVQGQTESGIKILINSREVSVHEGGGFEEKVDLTPGLNTITVIAEKKHGKTVTEVRHVVYKPAS